MNNRLRPTTILTYLLVCAFLNACAYQNTSPDSGGSVQDVPKIVLSNMIVVGMTAPSLRLNDGAWTSQRSANNGDQPVEVTLLDNATREVMLDGRVATVTLLSEWSGGTGVWVYLGVVVDTPQGNQIAAASVGDRVQIVKLDTAGANIELLVVEAGPNEPMCCPATLRTRSWHLDGSTLQQLPPGPPSALSVAALQGVVWRLVDNGDDDAVASRSKITLQFADEQVSGQGACNRYFASVTEDDARSIAIGPVGATRMACPLTQMQFDQHYHRRLGHVSSYAFEVGQLVLTGSDDGNIFELRFDREVDLGREVE